MFALQCASLTERETDAMNVCVYEGGCWGSINCACYRCHRGRDSLNCLSDTLWSTDWPAGGLWRGWTAKGHPETALITQDKDLNRTAGKGSLNGPLGAINRHFLRFTHRHIKRAKCYEASDGKVITALLTRWSVKPLWRKQSCSVNINIEPKSVWMWEEKGKLYLSVCQNLL